MFKNILVPLDGSHLAEVALPAAGFLAQKLGSTITLIHVIEKNPPEAIHGEKHLSQADEATSYLEQVGRSKLPAGLSVATHVHTTEVSNVAASIVDHVSEFEPDLILMCSHGRGGLRDFVVGSIAQQVIGMGKTPVLLLHPEEGQNPLLKLEKILVGVDGNPEHESVLPLAGGLAKLFEAQMRLVTVVPTLDTLRGGAGATGRLLPGSSWAMLEVEAETAEERLLALAKTWLDQGVQVRCEVVRGEAANKLAESARGCQADMVVVGTHGKAGMTAFWAGSVAPRLPGLISAPLLLVPVRSKD